MELEDTSWFLNDWERLMGSGADKPRRSWSLFKHQWSDDDLMVVRGLVPAGTKPWNEVDVVLIPCNLEYTHWALASVDLTIRSIYLMDLFRQEDKGGNCGAHTLRLIEYLVANRDTFDCEVGEDGGKVSNNEDRGDGGVGQVMKMEA
ncbi:hypothetical protein LWI28_029142 [Acer negundo]|uniref:Ubiquitin-like protease family profile domain-containing protein n=1 Tax=Acer negundo TaxID=4023 RepID=A0AAD5P4K5_ACENE|nr:hypothetical protein LWI28_029142 [Acer negundo]